MVVTESQMGKFRKRSWEMYKKCNQCDPSITCLVIPLRSISGLSVTYHVTIRDPYVTHSRLILTHLWYICYHTCDSLCDPPMIDLRPILWLICGQYGIHLCLIWDLSMTNLWFICNRCRQDLKKMNRITDPRITKMIQITDHSSDA